MDERPLRLRLEVPQHAQIVDYDVGADDVIIRARGLPAPHVQWESELAAGDSLSARVTYIWDQCGLDSVRARAWIPDVSEGFETRATRTVCSAGPECPPATCN